MNLRETLGLDKDPIFLMDGTAFIYRSFYAQRHLRRSDGYPTNALTVLTRVLLRVLRRERPRYFLFAMDGKGKNFRNRLYPDYKANREKMPEELIMQLEPISRMVEALGIRRQIAEDVEADDCIASLASRFSGEHPVVIISGDKDLKQCLSPSVFMWDPGSKEEKILSAADFTKETGVSPAQWPDMQALIGDSSDNIPGVAGIGPKTAKEIFAFYPNLEAISAHLDEMPQKWRDKLLAGQDSMYLWRELTTLRRDACPNLSLDDLKPGSIDLAETERISEEYELAAIRREIASLAQSPSADNKRDKKIAPAPDSPAIEINVLSAPDCRGATVAVIWPDKLDESPRVALREDSGEIAGDFVWKDTQASLCAWLKNSAALIVADIKILLRKFPSWLALIVDEGYANYSDLGLASYLLSPEEGDYSWKKISSRYRENLGENRGPAALALRMAAALEKNLASKGMTDLYRKLELPLAPVLALMEIRGFAISPAAFRLFLDETESEASKLEKEIFDLAGTSFNIRSSRQLAEILFDRMKLPASRKTKGGLPSTSQLALEKLAADHKIVDLILNFRRFDKMRSTYLDPLPRLMDKDHRIHTTFNQEATATGRLSSSDPNLQNIPVRGALGERMRGCFVAAPGKTLIAADYSQIELRLLAHFSQDPALLEAFRNGEDIHARTAALVFDSPRDKIQPDQRRMAKTINFGLLYGM
nr:DNA polymerase I [Desulfovibrio sp.]